ncbi:MAG: DUF58 domain-containing protein [Candidatus Bipolaricaulota bacterium]|nr:DUF58 domain-containing protein [Candidatus Bipolaricaulota bacterium]
MMLGPRRWAFLGSAAFLLVLVGEILRQGELLVLALPLVCYLAVGFYSALPPLTLKAQRSLNTKRAMSDEPVTVRVELENLGATLELIELVDSVPTVLGLRPGSPQKIASLPAGEKISLEYAVSGMRGLARWKNLSVRVTDTLGLFLREMELPCEGELVIVPTFERLEEIVIRPRRTRIFSGQVKARLGGAGIEFFGVREYYPGDERRFLNWKATARRDRPIVNEFEQERVADVIILLDARERSDVIRPHQPALLTDLTPTPSLKGRGSPPSLGEGAGERPGRGWGRGQEEASPQSLFEHSVRAALALAHYFTAQGNRVGLLIYGKYLDWTWPGFGRWQRERLLRAIVSAEKGDKAVFEDLENIPTRLLPAGSQLVFVGPILESDVKTIVDLKLRYEVLCIAPNPILFESAFLERTPEVELALRLEYLKRHALLAHLRRVGIRVVDWDVNKPLAAVVRGELGRSAWRAALIRRGTVQP